MGHCICCRLSGVSVGLSPRLWALGLSTRLREALGAMLDTPGAQRNGSHHHMAPVAHPGQPLLPACSPTGICPPNGSQIRKMYKCKLVDFIKILLILCLFLGHFLKIKTTLLKCWFSQMPLHSKEL